MNKIKKRIQGIFPLTRGRGGFKNPGVTILIPTIILSGLILMVALGLSRVLMTELEFSADLLFSEKAYFAAESGVEKSLLALKDKPLNYVVEADKPVGKGATYSLVIANKVKEFDIDLDHNKSVKFRLGHDDSESFAGYSLIPVTNFEINTEEKNKNVKWKILCLIDENPAKKTVALFGNGRDFTSGNFDDGTNATTGDDHELSFTTESVSQFLGQYNNIENLCFMSLTNFGEREFRGIFTPTLPEFVAPAKVNITATGKSFSREKIVSFDYWQKNLSALYDLGLYFTGETK